MSQFVGELIVTYRGKRKRLNIRPVFERRNIWLINFL